MKIIRFRTSKREEIIDITGNIDNLIKDNKWLSGIILVYSPHTTAGITVNENADPSVKEDLSNFLKKLVPQNHCFSHAEANSDSHIKGTLCGFSQSFIIEDSKLQLGTWQGIYFLEFDGPRSREIWVKFTPG
ncbi:MAG: YjbQ family protein [Candidatus Omnitrophica bacterium]|nr:YjbQ family protein [Candidatus Omnitrophota bacterium]